MSKWKRPVGRYKGGREFIYTWPGTLFTYMFAQCYYDFREVGEDVSGVDWFENTRRAAAANRDWCRDNAERFASYGRDRWGITACSGPGGRYVVPGHQPRGARGDKPEAGTLAPYGAAMALPYLKADAMAAIRHMRRFEVAGKPVWKGLEAGGYGFCDALNVDEKWVSDRVLGIAQGPMLVMIENARSGFVWKTFMADADIQAGIRRSRRR